MKGAWLGAAMLVACGGANVDAGVQASTSAPPAAAPPPKVQGIAPVAADVELRDASGAVVAGRPIAFDGIEEALAWPALARAIAPKPGAPIAITVARDVPVRSVLRAVWTLRAADVRLQTTDDAGILHVIDLRPKPAAPSPGCHLAVFVAGDGSLRVAAPGGPRAIAGPSPAQSLAQALDAEKARCPIRYVAFGADARDAKWASVFDVAWAVARDGAAGDARFVLGEPVSFTAPAR